MEPVINPHTLTCTEILLKTLEHFGESEAEAVVVLYINKNDEIVITRNAKNTLALGLCEYGRQSVKNAIFREDR
jgi:hypothetical protein